MVFKQHEMKKGPKKTSFILSFLDVLSNALAAVFILTMVRLQPDSPGLSAGGLYYVQVSRDNPVTSDSTLMLATKFRDSDTYSHEPKEYLKKHTRMIITENYAKNIFLKEPELRDFEDVFCYLTDPDFSLAGECITIQIKLPNVNMTKTVWLDKNNEFRVHFIKDGRIQNEAFYDCYAVYSPDNK